MDDRSTAEETGLQLGASNLTDSFAEFLHPDPGTGDDSEGLSTHVQTIARRVYQEFEAVLEAHGPAVLEPLMPIMVNVLEKLDELFKDQFAYRAEVTQLREDKASLIAELEREKTIRKDAEDRLLSAEDQFEDERKTLNEALLQNETLIKQLELKSQNALDQLARMEKREADSSNENSKLHGRIDELLRSNLELADNLKNAVTTPIRPTPPKPSGNAFDTTSGGVGFDELSANEGDISPCEDELTDDFSTTVPVSEFEPSELARSSSSTTLGSWSHRDGGHSYLTTALAVPSPVENDTTEYLWLIGRGPSLQASPSSGRGTKLCGKVYLYDPLQLYEPLGSLDLVDDFLPLCAGYFTAGLQDSPTPGNRQSKMILSDCVICCQGSLPSNTSRVIVASSDGRFVICGSSPRPKSASQTQTFDLLPLVTFRLANAGESAASLVSLDHRVCLGVVNSTGSNQLVTLKWHLSSEAAAAATPLDDATLNAQLGSNAQSLPGTSGAPSGPIIMSTIYETFFWLGTAGGGTLHCFDLSSDDFVSNLSLPPDSPCLHAVAVGPAASASEARLIWLAVSGSSQVSLSHLDEKAGPPCGPHSRLLSVCSSRRVFLHCVDLTALLVSRIDMSDVVDPVDLTVCRLFVQADECIWFATRCGLIGRFFHNYLLNHESSDAPVDRKDSISLSCHGYKRPVSALIPIGHVGQDSEGTPVPADRRTPSNAPHSLLVVAVGHDYVYLHTTSTAPASFPSLDSTTSRRSYKLVPGAHAIVWSLPES
nr:unnamed protein product [Spirometra erinaceieuropaei]